MKTVWSIFKDLVNSKAIGEKITRRELIAQTEIQLLADTATQHWEERRLAAKFSPVTLDCQRNMSEKVGFLKKTERLGVYEVVSHFEPDYTVHQLRKDYDNAVWKE